MTDESDGEENRRGKPLLSLGSAIEDERRKVGVEKAGGGSSSAHADAVARHQRARARREGQQSRILTALGESEAERRQAPEPVHKVEQDAKPGLVDRFLRWPKGDAPAEEPLLRHRVAPEDAELRNTLGRIEERLARQEAEAVRIANRPAGEPPVFSDWRERPDETDPYISRPATASTGTSTSGRGGGRDGGNDDGGDDDGWKPLIDPARVIGGIVNAKRLILLTTLIGAGLGVLVALSTPKKFEAVAEILIDPRDLKIVDRTLTDINGLPSDSTIAIVENQVRVLTSTGVLNRVVEKLNLESDPEFNGQGGGISLNPLGFVRSLLTGTDGSAEPSRLRTTVVTNLAENLSVERTGKTFVVLVHAKSIDAEKAARIANTMTEVFVQTSGRMQSDTAGRANDELSGRLEQLRKDLETAEQKVEKYRADNELIGAQGRLITDEEILKLNDQLSVTRAKTLELNARAESTRSLDAESVINGSLPEAGASGVITELRTQYASAKQEADRLAVRLGPRHPSLQSAQVQAATARDQIAVELRRIAAQVQTELKRSVQLEQELAARLAQLKVRQGDVSSELVALRELEREANAKRAVYESYLLRARETSEQKDINTTNVSVISEAMPPLRPSGPSRAMISVAGALLGFLAGVGIGGLQGVIGGMRESGTFTRRRSVAAAGKQPKPAGPQRADVFKDYPSAETVPEEDPMYPPYVAPGYGTQSYATPAQQSHAAAPVQHSYPQAPYAQAPHYPQPQPAPYPQPQHPYAQAPWQQPAPQQPVYPQPAPPQQPVYGQPMPAPYGAPPHGAYPQATYPGQPLYAEQASYPYQPGPFGPQPGSSPDSLSQLSESLREFRDAVRELTESRQRRRYF